MDLPRPSNHDQASAWCKKYIDLGYSHLWWQVSDEDAAAGGGKGPTTQGWNTGEFGVPPESSTPYQCGLRTGARVGKIDSPAFGCWLACVDVDDPELQGAVEAALPKTGMAGGKKSTPRSHLFYAVTDGPCNSFKWLGPRNDGKDGCLLELRGCDRKGGLIQVLVAPSQNYAKDEPVVWDSFEPPARVTADQLYKACWRALDCKAGQARLAGKGRPPSALWQPPKADKAVKLHKAAEEFREGDGERKGRPVEAPANTDDCERIIAHAAYAAAKAEKGRIQETLNSQTYRAASLLAGAGASDELFDKLRSSMTSAADRIIERGDDVNMNIWLYTVDRALDQGRSRPRKRFSLKGYKFTDAGSADLLAEEWRDDFRYLVTAPSDGGGRPGQAKGEWREWSGTHWAATTESQVARDAVIIFRWAAAESAYADDADWEKEALKYYMGAEASGKASACIGFLKAFVGRGGLAQPRDIIDRDPWLFNCKNGTFDIRTGELRPHRREDMLTKVSPYSYRSGTASGMMMEALHWAFAEQPDALACVEYLLSWFGYFATGDVSAQQLLVLYGNGRNGKSKLIEAVGKCLGAYACGLQKEVLVQTGNESKCTDEIAELHSRRFGWFSELSSNEFLNEGRVKQLTGNSKIKARRMFEGTFEFDATCKFLIDTNYQPRIRGTDFGILRRVKPLPYLRTIPEDKVVPNWDGRVLEAEGDALLTMILDQAVLYYKRGLAPEPLCVKDACKQFSEDNDHIGCFISDCCVCCENPADPDETKCGAQDLYDHYRIWAKEGGYTPLNVKNFGQKLLDKGWIRARTPLGQIWKGISVRPRINGGLESLKVIEEAKTSA